VTDHRPAPPADTAGVTGASIPPTAATGAASSGGQPAPAPRQQRVIVRPAQAGDAREKAAGPSRRPRRAWAALLTGWLALFIIGTDLFVVSPLLPVWRTHYGVQLRTAGLTVTVFAVAYVLAAPFWGRRAAVTSPPAVLSAALSGFAVFNVLTACAPTFWMLLAARAGAGLFVSGATATVFSLVGMAAPEGRRAAWLGIATSGLLSALWAGAPLGDLIARHTNWRAVFIGLSVLALGILMISRRVWPAAPSAHRAAPPTLGPLPSARAVAPTACWAAAVYGLYTYLTAGLDDRDGWSTGWVNTALVTYGICAVAATFLGGRTADRRGTHTTTCAALLLLATADVLFAASLHSRPWLTCLATALIALAAYTAFPAKQAQLITHHPTDQTHLLAWNQSAMYLGITLGSLAGGPIAEHHFTSLPLACAALALLGLTTQLATPSPTKPPRRDISTTPSPESRAPDNADR
jgi:predicted MFS family arabinose efflux permease